MLPPPAKRPSSSSNNSEYTPTPLPVLNQMRAAGILPSLEALEAEDSSPAPAPASSLISSLPMPPTMPKAVAEAAKSPVPAKVARVEEISPFDYLKNIIEGKKMNVAPAFACSQSSEKPQHPQQPQQQPKHLPISSDAESETSSPVKSRLLPPVELDYAPVFAAVPTVSSLSKSEAVSKVAPASDGLNKSPLKSPRIAPAFRRGETVSADFRLEASFSSSDDNNDVDSDSSSKKGKEETVRKVEEALKSSEKAPIKEIAKRVEEEAVDDSSDDVMIISHVIPKKKKKPQPPQVVSEEVLKKPRVEKTPQKTARLTARMALTGDNIFARLSSLSSFAAAGDNDDNEYVPSFVGAQRKSGESGTTEEYTPSTSGKPEAEYVPQFLSSRAAKSAKAEYKPDNFVDLTVSPTKDANRIAISGSEEEEEDGEEEGKKRKSASAKVTRSRTFIRERSTVKQARSCSLESEEEFACKKKTKKKKKKRSSKELEEGEEEEAVVEVPKVKKKKNKRKEKTETQEEVLRSLFGGLSDDDDEEVEELESPSSSKTAAASSVALPSSSRGPPRAEPEPQLSSYYDPVRQKWYREDGSEDTARSAASSSSSKSPVPAKSASGPVAKRARPGNPFQLSARDVMHKRMQWFEQLKLEAAAKAMNPKHKDRNNASSSKLNNGSNHTNKAPSGKSEEKAAVAIARNTGALVSFCTTVD